MFMIFWGLKSFGTFCYALAMAGDVTIQTCTPPPPAKMALPKSADSSVPVVTWHSPFLRMSHVITHHWIFASHYHNTECYFEMHRENFAGFYVIFNNNGQSLTCGLDKLCKFVCHVHFGWPCCLYNIRPNWQLAHSKRSAPPHPHPHPKINS